MTTIQKLEASLGGIYAQRLRHGPRRGRSELRRRAKESSSRI